ncbi:hypothetical protein HPB50_021660 [Hyalomma asiaticum]|uniref:Uncharacterized protein n=1 Tax=Hyalomma asiaticum TaxID=266040 RepID=A0ACB7TBB6_HYAAI|nr:hypothetical protein HPB50_021660 [Hyalomma asiaticum]
MVKQTLRTCLRKDDHVAVQQQPPPPQPQPQPPPLAAPQPPPAPVPVPEGQQPAFNAVSNLAQAGADDDPMGGGGGGGGGTRPMEPAEEPMEEEDEARSEATFRFVVPEFSRLKESLLSPPTYVRNLPWKIMVMPRTNAGNDRQPTKSLGFFLQCNGESESSTWSCNATAELRLISQKEGVENFVRTLRKYDGQFAQYQAGGSAI